MKPPISDATLKYKTEMEKYYCERYGTPRRANGIQFVYVDWLEDFALQFKRLMPNNIEAVTLNEIIVAFKDIVADYEGYNLPQTGIYSRAKDVLNRIEEQSYEVN